MNSGIDMYLCMFVWESVWSLRNCVCEGVTFQVWRHTRHLGFQLFGSNGNHVQEYQTVGWKPPLPNDFVLFSVFIFSFSLFHRRSGMRWGFSLDMSFRFFPREYYWDKHIPWILHCFGIFSCFVDVRYRRNLSVSPRVTSILWLLQCQWSQPNGICKLISL